tara:strand:- start:170 stop:472 length:303 start_codon:yes stop_codon:yes gene_type:complete
MAFHMLTPKRIEIIEEKIIDLVIEKFIMLKALTKIIVRPVKKENQLNIVLGFSNGIGDIFFVAQSFILDFIMSANINPDIRQIKAPQESQKIGSSIGFIF